MKTTRHDNAKSTTVIDGSSSGCAIQCNPFCWRYFSVEWVSMFSHNRNLRNTVVQQNHTKPLQHPKLWSGVIKQWRIQDLSEGQAQSQDWNVNTTSDVIAKRSLEGEALAFLGGSGGMLPRKILKIEMLRYAFSALLGVFLSLNKGSKLLSWIVTKLKTPTVCYGWVGLFYVCENPRTFYERHTGWAWLSRRTPLRAYLSSKSFPSMAPETLTTSRNSNAVETRLVSTPFGSYRCIRLEPDLDGLKMLVDSSTGSLRRKFYWSEFARSKTG